MRVYIIGPVTGCKDGNISAFEDAASLVQKKGHTAFIPHMFVPKMSSWETAMRRSIEALLRCDEVCLLPDWRDSKGATIERNLAIDIGIPVRSLAYYAI